MLIKNSGDRMSEYLPPATHITVRRGTARAVHSEKDKLNRDLIDFLTGTEVRGDQTS